MAELKRFIRAQVRAGKGTLTGEQLGQAVKEHFGLDLTMEALLLVVNDALNPETGRN